jgi:hypothetical protein
MPPKTVASLLAQQDDAVLVEMRDSIQAEITRLQMELSLVTQALGRRPRRSTRGSGDSEPRRFSGVKRSDVLSIVGELEQPVAPAQVRHQLELRGITISGAAVRNHLRRLVRDGQLEMVGEGAYALMNGADAKRESVPPLFTGDQTPSPDSTSADVDF